MLESVFALILAISIAIERLVEVVKPLYLQVKKVILKKEFAECSKAEKTIISIVVGIILGLVSGVSFGIPSISIPIQGIIAGLVASIGSNVLHTLISLLGAFKEAAEDIKVQK
jgi:hypothetical protein